MKNTPPSRQYWNTAVLLMSFTVLNHLLAILTLVITSKLLPFVFPLSFLIASILSVYLCKQDGYGGIKLYLPMVVGAVIIMISLLFSTLFYDFTFDGQWYHHPAIFKLEGGWNPFLNPLDNAHKSILHFPKGTWYFSASVYSALGIFEMGKCLNIIMIAIATLMVYATLIDYKVGRVKSIAVSAIVVLHPVVWSEITTFQNDNNLYLNLVVYVISIPSWLRTNDKTPVLLGIMAGICIINIKFTGLVFLIVFAGFGLLYFIIYKPQHIWKYIVVHVLVMVLGVGVFGFNPYVTNFIHRGHPFYPVMGTAEYPSHISDGKDGNEIYETPKNMMGKPTLVRFFYANFSKPSNAPYNRQKDAELIFPFTSKTSDWKVYRFHDLRIAAFGPFFSGLLVLSFAYLIFLMFKLGKQRWHLVFPILAIFTSLALSKHFWWARFGPQLWLFPITLIVTTFLTTNSKPRKIFNWGMISLMFINGIIVLTIHLSWVRKSTVKQRKQLTELRNQAKPIEICMYWFNESMNRKLVKWGIEYKEISRKEMRKLDKREFKVLHTVVNGYPGMNRYRILEDNDE
ncbi:MAG: hypothetical protein MI922_15360 [Bacteroidales bacterium]|nr:hypothetical protein [Bacteroidales bacterium]